MERICAGDLEARTELVERPMYENTQPVLNGEHYSGRNFMKAIPKILIGTVIVGGSYLVVRSCSGEIKSWNEGRIKDAAFIKSLNYILPRCGETKNYIINSKTGTRVAVSHIMKGFSHRLRLELNDEIKFISDSSFNGLEELYLKKEGNWEEFKWRRVSAWQKRYEDLVAEVYKTRSEFEGTYGESLDKKFRNDSGKP